MNWTGIWGMKITLNPYYITVRFIAINIDLLYQKWYACASCPLYPITLLSVSDTQQSCVSLSLSLSSGNVYGGGKVSTLTRVRVERQSPLNNALIFIIDDDVAVHAAPCINIQHKLHLKMPSLEFDDFMSYFLKSENPTLCIPEQHTTTPPPPQATPPPESNVIGCLRCRHRMLFRTKTSSNLY
jgi:hypothetical protein